MPLWNKRVEHCHENVWFYLWVLLGVFVVQERLYCGLDTVLLRRNSKSVTVR